MGYGRIAVIRKFTVRSHKNGMPCLVLNEQQEAEQNTDDPCHEGAVIKQFWIDLFKGIEQW